MAITKPTTFYFFTILIAAFLIAGFLADEGHPNLHTEWNLQGVSKRVQNGNSWRLMIGSTVPTCTYNECRGCKFKCIAEQIPVDGNDPINSAYRYRCVCHR
ncbi:EPIDERMAL PATTERNING FACTOR-like protein 9 [Tasmannia lanceolata]|uniref:EPIDERMAL PATTERNING FACTOR-like protein 9 n=1 Tax=Tasmannia lanceolata TaxID=3420 RepID=UPI0040642C79